MHNLNNLYKKIIITGSLGLIGYETACLFLEHGYQILGIDNDFRSKQFSLPSAFGSKLIKLNQKYPKLYKHFNIDIRSKSKVKELFQKNLDISAIIHTAGQTAHDWSAIYPTIDFDINVKGTQILLENYRKYIPGATFIYTSTNKVYGDKINTFKFKELENRYDLLKSDKLYNGISENFSVDDSLHSPFGVSKLSADLLVQEYGKYYNLKTGVFRLGVVTGLGQNGAFLQGFLSYMIKNAIENKPLQIVGYKGKQVRDIIHAKDVAQAFYDYTKNPDYGEVFNLGGGRENSASLIEIIDMIKTIKNSPIEIQYLENPRKGDHQWWITNNSKFKSMYPEWRIKYTLAEILTEIYNAYK